MLDEGLDREGQDLIGDLIARVGQLTDEPAEGGDLILSRSRGPIDQIWCPLEFEFIEECVEESRLRATKVVGSDRRLEGREPDSVATPLIPEECAPPSDRKSTRLNSSHVAISYA